MDGFGSVLQTLIALIFVLCLIGLCSLLARRFMPMLAAGTPIGQRRLKIVESLPLDARRRAVLLRCDGREHLLVVGEAGVTVVERNLSMHPSDGSAPP